MAETPEGTVRLALDGRLQRRLAALERILSRNRRGTSLPLLLLEVGPEGLAFVGVGSQVDLEVRLPLPFEGRPGRVWLPDQPFFSLPRSLPEEEVELGFGEVLSLSAGSFRTELRLAEGEDYPALQFPGEEASDGYPFHTRLSREEFLKALGHVRYAADKKGIRPVFEGVQMEFSEGGFRAVATDGYRLALYHIPIPQPFEAKAVVPANAVEEAAKVLKETPAEEVEVALGQGALGLTALHEGGGVRLVLRLLEGGLPEYEKAFPQAFPTRVSFGAKGFLEALERVSVLAQGEGQPVSLEMGEGRILLQAEGTLGQAQEEVPAQVQGEPLRVLYNGRFLGEALAPLEGEAQLLLSGPQTPTLVTGSPEGSYRALLVPLRRE